MKEKKEEAPPKTSPLELSEEDRLKNTYCRHMKIEFYCRYCAANELGELIRGEWPCIPWKGLTSAIIQEANAKTYSKDRDGQNVMF